MAFFGKKTQPAAIPQTQQAPTAPATNEASMMVLDSEPKKAVVEPTEVYQDPMPEEQEPEQFDNNQDTEQSSDNNIDDEEAAIKKQLADLQRRKAEQIAAKEAALKAQKPALNAANLGQQGNQQVIEVPVFVTEAEYLRIMMSRIQNIEAILSEIREMVMSNGK
jgi:hypothetical protein